METSVQAANGVAETIRQGSVSELKQEGGKTVCYFDNIGSILLSNSWVPIFVPATKSTSLWPLILASAGTELYIRKTSSSGRSRDLYQAPSVMSRAPSPISEGNFTCGPWFPRAGWAFSPSICLATWCAIIFMSPHGGEPWERQTNLYDVLRITPTASPAELRVSLQASAIGTPRCWHFQT